MPNQEDRNPKTCCRGLFRFHRSTLVIASLMIVPWLLVALPGRTSDEIGERGWDGWSVASLVALDTRYQQHGLPFVFLERQTVFESVIDPAVDYDALAAKYLANEGHERIGSACYVGNLSVCRSAGWLDDSLDPGSGFWSDASRWPWIGKATGEAMRIRWWGLLVDAMLILLAFFLFARVVQHRLKKRGSHFAFSLAELLAATFVTAVCLTWITTEYRRASKENTAIDQLQTAMHESGGNIEGNRCNGLPVLVSELFDHRSSLPLLEQRLFRPVEQAEIILPANPEGLTGDIIDAIGNVHFPIDLEIHVNEHNLPVLAGIKNSPAVKRLYLGFDFDLGWYRRTDACIDDLDFKLELPSLEELTISLHSEINQKKQLGIIAPKKALIHLQIRNLNQEGAAYFNSIAKDFPAVKKLEIVYGFSSELDNPSPGNRNETDLEFESSLSRVEIIKIWLQSEFDQEKQLRMLAAMKHMTHLKSLEIHGLNRKGAAYLNSIAKDLPRGVLAEVEFESDDGRIKLLDPIKETENPFF